MGMECKFVMRWYDKKFYLRRSSDPSTGQISGVWGYTYTCKTKDGIVIGNKDTTCDLKDLAAELTRCNGDPRKMQASCTFYKGTADEKSVKCQSNSSNGIYRCGA